MAGGKGLKAHMGVSDPNPGAGKGGAEGSAKPGSNGNANDFRKTFKNDMKTVAGCLTYTAVHAEEAKHKALDKRRDEVLKEYQNVLKTIEKSDPNSVKGATIMNNNTGS